MPIIQVEIEDDVEGEKVYDVAFIMTSRSVAQTWEQPAEGAEFEVRLIWDEAGHPVKGGEFDAVASEVLDCYHEEMEREARSC